MEFEPIRNFLLKVRAADMIDIAVMSVLIFLALSWLTRRLSLLFILSCAALIAGLYAAANALQMYLTLFTLRGGALVIALALLVLFQRDLQRGLERLLAWRPFRTRTPGPPAESMVDVLVEAVAILAGKRTGALIILRGKEPLENHIRGGVPLRGALSVPLLLSIFAPETPGHDGAVVIEGDRVERFGAHLPLSENLREVGQGGTRHSAGLGLAERSDALVIVISEERGTISVAHEGTLEVLRSPADLKPRIDAFLDVAHGQGATPPKRIRRSALLAGTSICVSCVLWLLFAYQTDIILKAFDNIPVEFRNVPAHYQIENMAPAKIEVTLQGSERAFRGLQPERLSVSIDASRFDVGTHEIAIKQEMLNLKADLQLRRASPSTVRFEIISPPQPAATNPSR